MSRFKPPSDRACRAVAALAVALSALICSPAQAQLNFGAFTVKVTEKEMKLEHPTDLEWQNYLMRDLPFQRTNDRNMPYIELTNDSDSTAPITEFHLTIGDERFNFTDKNMGTFALVGTTTKEFELTSSTVNNQGNELVVKIDGGLARGDLVRFKIDLEVDAAFKDQFFAHPDFRTVLFDMNGLNVYDGFLQQVSSADNAKASAIFDPSSGVNFTVGPVPLIDEPVLGAAAGFFNDQYRSYRDSDPVRTFFVTGELAVVPEPTGAALAVIGVVGGLLSFTRSRRTTNTA